MKKRVWQKNCLLMLVAHLEACMLWCMKCCMIPQNPMGRSMYIQGAVPRGEEKGQRSPLLMPFALLRVCPDCGA